HPLPQIEIGGYQSNPHITDGNLRLTSVARFRNNLPEGSEKKFLYITSSLPIIGFFEGFIPIRLR
ncbi:MAG: hypothetical protein AAB489_03850, partial [Patescibacteria group bacterium]